ncbi:hypothetical protein [Nitratireductor pacificus]|uniref:hypothetical protein n=1 Tax=Nitratireductor pacificus TaxID=1231180 RepID=UPI0002E719AD|nr:hypothetical protein [Nitratireductor pacificus]
MVVKSEIDAFRRAKEARGVDARQTAALALVCGIDLPSALRSSGTDRIALQQRLKRMIERERLKGARGHWSYDLNRHIALGQALQRLSPPSDIVVGDRAPVRRRSRHRPPRHGS